MKKIGIIGAGNIGLTLAKLLLQNKVVDLAHLGISFRGNTNTLEKLKAYNLDSSIKSNKQIIENSDIIFITIKPKDFQLFKENDTNIPFKNTAIVISTVAGYPLSQLKSDFNNDNIYNLMPSGPETLLEGKGIAALYPINDTIVNVLRQIKVQPFSVTSEDAFYLFTTALCLPAAFLQLNAYPSEEDAKAFISQYTKLIPQFAEVYQWAKSVTPLDLNDQVKKMIIKNMSTEGGVTENLVIHIIEGNGISDAFSKAVDYCTYLGKK